MNGEFHARPPAAAGPGRPDPRRFGHAVKPGPAAQASHTAGYPTARPACAHYQPEDAAASRQLSRRPAADHRRPDHTAEACALADRRPHAGAAEHPAAQSDLAAKAAGHSRLYRARAAGGRSSSIPIPAGCRRRRCRRPSRFIPGGLGRRRSDRGFIRPGLAARRSPGCRRSRSGACRSSPGGFGRSLRPGLTRSRRPGRRRNC